MAIKIIRLYLVVFFSSVWSQDEAFFGSGEPLIATDGAKCNTIEGTVKGCTECYPCDHKVIQTAERDGQSISKLTLYNSKCIGTKVCCIRSLETSGIGSRIGGECGRPGFAGGTDSIRDFGPREFPWMAFVYSKRKGAFNCAATVIGDRLLLTAASCVQDLSVADMKVSFNYKPSAGDNMVPVSNVVKHEDFDSKNHKNDIALIKLDREASIPQWVSPACLPTADPTQGTICTTVSQQNFYKLLPVTRKSKSCAGSGLVCSSPLPAAHAEPVWPGAGLYCEAQATQQDQQLYFTLHGVSAAPQSFTSVYKLLDWIETNK